MSRPRTRPYLRLDRAFRCEARWDLLSTDGQRLAWMILTDSTSTSLPGLLRMRRSTMVEDARMTSEAFDAAWAEVEAHRYARADWARGLVWILDGLTHNPPANADAILGWRTNWLALPECGLRDEAEAFLRAEVSRLATGWPKGGAKEALAEVFGGDTVGDTVSDRVSDTVSHTVEGSTPTPGSGSGSRSGSRAETKTGAREGECERESADSRKPLTAPRAPDLTSSGERETEREKPSTGKRVKPARMASDWTPREETLTPLLVHFDRKDLERQAVKMREYYLGLPEEKQERRSDWDTHFPRWIRLAVEKYQDLTPKPPAARSANVKPEEERPPTPEEQKANLAAAAELRVTLGWDDEPDEPGGFLSGPTPPTGPMDARIGRRLAKPKASPSADNDGEEAVS